MSLLGGGSGGDPGGLSFDPLSLLGSVTGLLGGFIDDAPKFGTQMVRIYESGGSPVAAANVALQSGGNAEQAETLRKQAGYNGGARSPDATYRDCGAFSIWLATAYGLAAMGLPTELPSRCASKQHASALDSAFKGTAWRGELLAIYEGLAARDPSALDLIDRLQGQLGVSVVSTGELRQYVAPPSQAPPSMPPASVPVTYDPDPPPSSPAASGPSLVPAGSASALPLLLLALLALK